MISFKYKRPVEQTTADRVVTFEVKDFELTVPFQAILSIPFIRVEETTIDFNAKSQPYRNPPQPLHTVSTMN